MTTVFRPFAVLVLLALVSACGQMGPLVIPEKTPDGAPAPTPAADSPAMEAPAPEPQVVKPEP